MSSTKSCVPCIPNCPMCDYNSSYCHECGTLTKRLNAYFGKCGVDCYFDNCIKCDADYFICEECGSHSWVGLNLNDPNFVRC